MGKWMKLVGSDGKTVCVKYVPGVDRFIDHGQAYTAFDFPLKVSDLPLYYRTAGNLQQVETTRQATAPTSDSYQQYLNAISNPSTFGLRTANNATRFIEFAGSSKVADAFMLVDIYIVTKSITTYTSGQNSIPGGTTVSATSLVCVTQAPDQVYSPAIFRNPSIYDQNIKLWRQPYTSTLTVSTDEQSYSSIMDSAYDQLENIFGPF